MMGDLDLLHMARDRAMPHAASAPPAEAVGEPPHGLARLSLDSTLSMTSSASAASPFGTSWGGPFGSATNTPTAAASPKSNFLMRQTSLPAHASSPMDIPGSAAAAAARRRASADYGLIRSSTFSPGGGGPNGGFAAASAAAASLGGGVHHTAAAGPGGARLPVLVRSLSKGLSASLDFR